MKATFVFRVLGLAALSLSTAFAEEEVEDKEALIDSTIALARSYLGEEEKLDAVSSLRYEGIVVSGSGLSGTSEIVFKKPNYYQIRTVIGGVKEVTTLNKTEGWRQTERVDQPGSWQLQLTDVADIYRMEAILQDTLGFLAEPKTRTGRILYEGSEEVEGRQTHVLVHYYGNGIWFRRNIDAETGRVLRKINDLGMIFIESEEMVVDGIRFPKTMVSRTITPEGEISMELSLSSIEVNEEIDTDIFDVPMMTE